MAEPPYKKNLERLASLQDRLSKVQKTAESLLATVSGTGDYTDKVANSLAPPTPSQPFCLVFSCAASPPPRAFPRGNAGCTKFENSRSLVLQTAHESTRPCPLPAFTCLPHPWRQSPRGEGAEALSKGLRSEVCWFPLCCPVSHLSRSAVGLHRRGEGQEVSRSQPPGETYPLWKNLKAPDNKP